MKPTDVDKWSNFLREKHYPMEHSLHDQTDNSLVHFCSCGQIPKELDITNNVCKVYRLGVLDSAPSVYANVFLHAGTDRNATIEDHRIFRVKNAMLSLEKSYQPPPVHRAVLSRCV